MRSRKSTVHAGQPSRNTRATWMRVALAVLTGGLAAAAVFYATRTEPVAPADAAPAASGVSFAPTVPNVTPPPGPAPEGMVWIPGGEFSMGAQDPPDMDDVGMKATLDSRPIHRVYVNGFWMDKTEVTNEQFARFVKATGYVTVAERTLPAPGRMSRAPPTWRSTKRRQAATTYSGARRCGQACDCRSC